jgi:hypothetical protein
MRRQQQGPGSAPIDTATPLSATATPQRTRPLPLYSPRPYAEGRYPLNGLPCLRQAPPPIGHSDTRPPSAAQGGTPRSVHGVRHTIGGQFRGESTFNCSQGVGRAQRGWARQRPCTAMRNHGQGPCRQEAVRPSACEAGARQRAPTWLRIGRARRTAHTGGRQGDQRINRVPRPRTGTTQGQERTIGRHLLDHLGPPCVLRHTGRYPCAVPLRRTPLSPVTPPLASLSVDNAWRPRVRGGTPRSVARGTATTGGVLHGQTPLPLQRGCRGAAGAAAAAMEESRRPSYRQ